MSDITINMCSFSDDTSQQKKLKQKLKQKQRRKRYLARKRNLKYQNMNTTGDSGCHQIPRPNGAKSAPPATSTYNSCFHHSVSASSSTNRSSKPSTSTHNLPSASTHSSSSSGTNRDNHEKPKPHVNSKSYTFLSSVGPSALSSPQASASASAAAPSKILAIDCEMVGAGPKGHISQLARCSIVSYEGDVVYDEFICPSMPVTDYRTRWSGIRRTDLIGARPYAEARKEILKLLMGKVVIGHAVHNDFKVLSYCHPPALTRDTSRIPLLNRKAGFPENQAASLKRLMKSIFNRDIQTGKRGHSSVEDAKATMELYRVVEVEWERTLASKTQR